MRRYLRVFSALAAFLACAATPSAETPWDLLTGFPAYVSMQTFHLPAAANVMGKTYLYYEVYVLNAYGTAIDITKLTVRASNGQVFAYDGDKLASMMRPIGVPEAPPTRTMAAAETAVFYVALPFESVHEVPELIVDELSLKVPKAGGATFTVKQEALRTNPRPPVVIAPPLRGGDWIAGAGPSNVSGHRRTIFYANGRPFLGQRFAIDWVEGKRDGERLSLYHGDPKKNENWYCWNAPLYAVADGVVVAEKTDLPENVPMQPPVVRVSQETIGGNYIVLDIGYGRFAFYAHLRPHSATVKLGDRVKAGEVIGRLGNSGNSTAPHLHFHITDAPQFLFADGEPYTFATLRAAQGSITESEADASATIVSPFETYRDTMPGENAIVDFGSK